MHITGKPVVGALSAGTHAIGRALRSAESTSGAAQVAADAEPMSAAITNARQGVRPSQPAAIADAVAGHKRVLVLTMDNTGGHVAMARAVADQVKVARPDAVVEIATARTSDAAKGQSLLGKTMQSIFMNPTISRLQRDHAPFTMKAMHAWRTRPVGINVERAANVRMYREPVTAQIERFKPDVVVSTHEGVTSALGAMRREGGLKNTATVATLIDANPHGLWLSPGIDNHVAYNPNDLGRLRKVFAGGPPESLHAVAARPPVDPRSLLSYDRAAVRKEFGLPMDKQVILISGGSLGVPVPADLPALVKHTDAHLAVATGKNEELLKHLKENFPADRVTPIGSTKKMPELIGTSDAVLLNSNGMTSYEAMAAGTPVIMFNPVAGWGTSSARALQEDGLATYAKTSKDLVGAIKALGSEASDAPQRAAAAKHIFTEGRSYADVILSTPARSSA